MIIPALMAVVTLACHPDPDTTRDGRRAQVAEMNAQATRQHIALTFDAGGIDARTLVIHSTELEQFSADALCQFRRAGFGLVVDVYQSHYRIWELRHDNER